MSMKIHVGVRRTPAEDTHAVSIFGTDEESRKVYRAFVDEAGYLRFQEVDSTDEIKPIFKVDSMYAEELFPAIMGGISDATLAPLRRKK